MDSNFVIALGIFFGAIYFAWRVRSSKPMDTAVQTLGIVGVFLLLRWILAVMAPNAILTTDEQVRVYWQPVFDRAGGGGVSTGNGGFLDSVGGLVGFGAVPGTGSQLPALTDTAVVPPITQSPPVQFVVSNPVSGTVPQVDPVWAAEQQRIAQEQEAERQKQAQLMVHYNQLAQFKGIGDIVNGELVLDYIEQLDPGNPTAARERIAISQAKQRIGAYRTLGSFPNAGVSRDDAYQAQVSSVLAGGYYVTVSDGGSMAGWSCKSEWATVRDMTGGWTTGNTFRVLRCYLDPFGGSETGAEFFVQ